LFKVVVIGRKKKEAGPLNEMSSIKLNEIFTLEGTAKECRRHSIKLTKFRCTGDWLGVFFLIQLST